MVMVFGKCSLRKFWVCWKKGFCLFRFLSQSYYHMYQSEGWNGKNCSKKKLLLSKHARGKSFFCFKFWSSLISSKTLAWHLCGSPGLDCRSPHPSFATLTVSRETGDRDVRASSLHRSLTRHRRRLPSERRRRLLSASSGRSVWCRSTWRLWVWRPWLRESKLFWPTVQNKSWESWSLTVCD